MPFTLDLWTCPGRYIQALSSAGSPPSCVVRPVHLTVAYPILPALLLNENQKEHQLNLEQREKLALMQTQIDAQSAQLSAVDALKEKLAKLERLNYRS
jgi:hypothetical protein